MKNIFLINVIFVFIDDLCFSSIAHWLICVFISQANKVIFTFDVFRKKMSSGVYILVVSVT